MGKPVVVDSDDLNIVLMLTGAIKTVEHVLYQNKNDPFVSKDENKIKQAHDRMAKECRRAMRGEGHPDYNTPLSKSAIAELAKINLNNVPVEVGHKAMQTDNYKELFTKGMIEYGSGYDVIYWGSSQEQQRLNPVERIMVRVTERGAKLLIDGDTYRQH